MKMIRFVMENKKFKDQRSYMTKEFNIQIPCRLAERIEAYASGNNTDITLIVIEALDTFLRNQKKDFKDEKTDLF